MCYNEIRKQERGRIGMTSIGLSEKYFRMFPSGMILRKMHLSEVTDPGQRALVEKYQDLAKALEEKDKQLSELQEGGRFAGFREKLCSRKCAAIRKQMKRIEESKALSSLLFQKRMILVGQRYEMEKEQWRCLADRK